MKKVIAVILVLASMITILTFSSPQSANSEYLRIHIRANSNSQVDQAIKYKVKDAVVDAMIPLIKDCTTKQQSIQTINNNLEYLESVATLTLKQNGFNYCVNAQIKNEKFPTRSYGEFTLEGGFYDALIMNLGSGEGDNWWCVVYPPLCFVNGGTQVNQFKSRILEIIQSFQ